MTTWKPMPWREADHRNHPTRRHNCRCRCEAVTDRHCPEHGEMALSEKAPEPQP